MRFSIASGTDNSLLQLIVSSSADVELHTHEIDNNTRPYGLEGYNQIVLRYNANGVGPHALTQRGTYTVPVNKWARLDYLMIHMIRVTAASAVGKAQAFIENIITGPIITEYGNIAIIDNDVGASDHMNSSPLVLFEANETLSLWSFDLSTGGTFDYSLAVHISEIDI